MVVAIEQKIRDIWKTEDKEFTPWLVENIIKLESSVKKYIKNIENSLD